MLQRATFQSAEQMQEAKFTAADGSFSFQPLKPGSYTLHIAKDLYAPVYLTDVRLEEGAPDRVWRVMLNPIGTRQAPATAGPPPPPPPPPPAAASFGSISNSVPRMRAGPIRVGGNVMAQKLTNKVNPIYPPECKTEAIQGIVLLRLTISKEGVPVEVEPINTMVDPRLVEAAKTAVWQWRYQPTLLNGNPVPIITQVDVNFTLAP